MRNIYTVQLALQCKLSTFNNIRDVGCSSPGRSTSVVWEWLELAANWHGIIVHSAKITGYLCSIQLPVHDYNVISDLLISLPSLYQNSFSCVSVTEVSRDYLTLRHKMQYLRLLIRG